MYNRPDEAAPLRYASLAGMGGCYALGAFADNFYKQAAILLAASTTMTAMQSLATVLFSLPFILFSAWAGWFSDRLAKKHIVVAAKGIELLAMLAGGYCLITANWNGILAVVFIMGAQSTLFSPAINGSIPENFSAHQVPRINSLIKLVSTIAILAGVGLAGVFMDARSPSAGFLADILEGLISFFEASTHSGAAALGRDAVFGRLAVAGFLLVVSTTGLLMAFLLRTIAPADQGGNFAFPWSGPLYSIRYALECRKDRPLFLVLLAEAWFYGVATLAVISIANLTITLGFPQTIAGLLSAVIMIGLSIGALLAGKYSAESWRRLLVPAATGMGLTLILAGITPLLPASLSFLNIRLCWLVGVFFLCGICGGIYLIPLTSFIQVRPSLGAKGKVIAVSNFMSFMSIALFGAAFWVIRLLPPAVTFFVYGVATLLFTFFFVSKQLAGFPGRNLRGAGSGALAWFLRAILSLRYAVTETGLESLPEDAAKGDTSGKAQKGGILFLPNHPALIDPPIVYSRLAGLRPRPLADERQTRGPAQWLAARVAHTVSIPDLSRDGLKGVEGVRQGLERVTNALRQGDNILLYPSGRLYRSSREFLGGHSAVARILAAAPQTRVVLVRTTGLWGSAFGNASGRTPSFTRIMLRGALTLLANLIFFMPRRRVLVEFAEPADIPRDGDKVKLNSYLEAFYNAAERPAMSVPRFFWQGNEPKPFLASGSIPADKDLPAMELTREDVPEEVRQRVYALLRESAELGKDFPLRPEQTLQGDLYLDSLLLVDVATALEAEFGYPIPGLEALNTVNDCLLAAQGRLDMGRAGQRGAAPKKWLAARPDDDSILTLSAHARTVPEAFLLLARQGPGRPITADRSGMRTRRQILTGALALSRRFASLPGERLGIMLPATPAALVVWLAALLAGKTPVFINWTVGPRNMRHCLELTGVSHAVTADSLLERLARAGAPMRDMPLQWVLVDRMAGELSFGEKVRAAVLAFMHCSPMPYSVSQEAVPETAAILFTSGSEAAPKGVPLSHRNIMTNAGDVASVLKVRRGDRLLAMLPPFHSFGLLVGLTLPAASGIAAAYHPNPTESAALVHLVRDYKLSLLAATPTYLAAMLTRARGSDSLAPLRYAFIGAEKCPEHVYSAFSKSCPDASLCEGYGVTECSPVISVNRPEAIVPGSIGHVLPSLDAAVVVEEEGGSTADGAGTRGLRGRRALPEETGMLLVRGPSVFSGYLGEAADPFVRFEDSVWYRTGDLVTQDAEGRLYFKGRLKRFVKLGGEMISLPQMEGILLEVLKGRPDLPEEGRPAIAVEVRPGSEEAGHAEILAFTPLPLSVPEINSMLQQAGLAPVYSVKGVIRVEEIPLLGTGKTDYRALRGLV